MSKLLAIKSPAGRLVASSARDTRTECIEDYIECLLRQGSLIDRRELHGLSFYAKMWRVMRRAGFRVVQVQVEVLKDQQSGWSWPEVREVAA